MKIDYYPLPKPEDLFNSLTGCKLFTVLDLSEAYLQIEVAEECRKYLILSTHLGYFMPTRLMFGIASAPAIFQQFVDELTRDLPFVKGYLDDIIIGAKTKEEMITTLFRLLKRLQEKNGRVKLQKCFWMQLEAEYLGFVISAAGLKVSPLRVQPILDARMPEDTSELRAWLGMVNFYRRFIPDCSSLLGPLNALLADRVPWVWTEECAEAINKCKQVLVANNVLMLYDPNKVLVLVCDASPVGLGCVLAHRIGGMEHPISFASATLSEAQRGYAQIDREALGIIFGLTKFYKYLAGRQFILVTDNLPLRWLLAPEKAMPMMTAARVQRWSMILRSFNYTIEYRPSAQMGAADMLSRLSNTTVITEEVHSLMPVIGNMALNAEIIAEETKKSEDLQEVTRITRNGWPEKMDTQHKAYPFFK